MSMYVTAIGLLFRGVRWVAGSLVCAALAVTAASAQVSISGEVAKGAEISGVQNGKVLTVPVPAGVDRLLVVTSCGSGNSPVATPTAAYNGRPMNEGASAVNGNTRATIWYLRIGTSATATEGQVVVVYDRNYVFDVSAVTAVGVDQIESLSGATTGVAPSFTLASDADDLVLDVIAGAGSGVAAANGQTLRAGNDNLPVGAGLDTAMSTRVGAASVTMAWTGFTSGIAHAALNLRHPYQPLSITTPSLVGTVVNTSYSATITAFGGKGPRTFAVTDGALPPGLTLASGGLLSGAPTAPGTYRFGITVTDATGDDVSGQFTLAVSGPPTVTEPTVSGITSTRATLGGTVAATDGLTVSRRGIVYAPAASNPSLQADAADSFTSIMLESTDPEEGAVVAEVGAPYAAEIVGLLPATTYSFRAYARSEGGVGYSPVRTFTTAGSPIKITPATLPPAVIGVPYDQRFSAAGGVGAVRFAPVGGEFPSDLGFFFGGAIGGTPTKAGTYVFVIEATDVAHQTAALYYTLVIAPPAPLAITAVTLPTAPLNTPGYNQALATTGGTGASSYRVSAGALPPGLTLSPGGVLSGTALTAGKYDFTVAATDAAAATAIRSLTIVVAVGETAQTIAFAALPNRAVGDAPFTLAATASSGLPVTFTVSGPATISGAAVTLTGAAGTVVVTAVQAGNGTFAAATVVTQSFNVVLPGDRFVNFSSRGRIAPDASRSLIAGFVVGGTQAKRVVVRAAGPALTQFGVTGALVNPKLQIFNAAGAVVAENDDWSGADTAAAFTQVSAFALPAGSKDAALLTTLNPGSYTMQITAGAETGIALAEVYDASPNPGIETQRLANFSSRGMVDPADGPLIGGFVIKGASPKKVLIRGVGPQLAAFGVTGTLADPRLSVLRDTTVIAQNDNWSTPSSVSGGQASATAAELAATAIAVGAFAFTPGSLDAAVLVTLKPGSYTVQVAGVGESAGVAMMEIYEVP